MRMIRSKPEIYLWMTASIIGCLGLKSVNYERLHSFLWDFHNWMKLWSFIHLWRTSSISGGRQQICQQNINVCQIWETACHRVPNSCHKTLQLSISLKKNVFLSQKLNVWHKNYKIATILPTHVIQYGSWLHLHVKMYKIGIMTNSWVHYSISEHAN